MRAWFAVVLGAAVVAASLAGARAVATAGGQPISGGLLGTGVLTYGHTTVPLSHANGIAMEWVKVAPGASFGWHYHRRPVAVVVTAGTLTLYDSSDPTCTPSRYSAGHGFVEPADHVHVARNEGNKPVSLYALYLGVPAKWRRNPALLDVPAKNPGNCPSGIQ